MRTSRDERGQAEVLGVVLLLGITVVSVGAVVVIGDAALNATQENVQGTAVENALYQYDAATTEVVYGSAERRQVSLGTTGQGSYEVRPEAGTVRITHRNYSGEDDEEIVNRSLGAFVYERGDTRIAYQGGGVFRANGEGSVVLSAPRMRYRSQTFTAPIIGVQGANERASSGMVSAVVKNTVPPETVYPNASNTYDGTKLYENPISGGAIEMSVQSPYYTAWGSYFETVGPDVNVTVNKSTNTATLVLPTEPIGGEGVSLSDRRSLRGIDTSKHAVNQMNITLPGNHPSSNSFGTATISISGFNGTYSVTLENNKGGKGPCKKNGDLSVDVRATYKPSATDTTQEWTNTDAFTNSTGAFTYGCRDGNYELYVNLTGSTDLTYQPGPEPTVFDEHPEDVDADGDPTTYNDSEPTSIDELTNHYVALTGGNTEIDVRSNSGNGGGNGDGNGGGNEEKEDNGNSGLNTDAATGVIDYESGTVITYLRVTNATVNTTLN